MLNTILLFIVRIAVRVFFRKIEVSNLEALPKHGPMIIAANHPSTFMDASVISCFLHQKPRYLAMAGIFKNPFNKWLLTSLRAIPVMRPQDSPTGMADTKFLFSKCFEKLAEGESLLIFPEGISVHGRQLHQIKSGAARIALGAEAEHDFKLGVKIVTIGLNYSNPRFFRSDLYINISNPIELKDWKEAYSENPRAASEGLTNKISNQLSEQIITTQDAEEDNLLAQIEAVYKGRLLEKFGWDATHAEDDFRATKGLEQALHYYKEIDINRVVLLQNKLNSYFHNLDQLRLKNNLFDNMAERKSFYRAGLRQMLYLVLGCPIWMYGFVNNYLAYTLPSRIAYLLTKYEGYIAPTMMFLGVLTFSIFYSVQTWLVHDLIGIWWLTLLYAITLPLTGFFTLSYWQNLQNTKDQWTLLSTFYKKGDLVAHVIKQRTEIVEMLDEANQEYLKKFDDLVI